MRGFGAVPEDAVNELNGVVHELRALVTGLERYLNRKLNGGLEQRLERLEKTGLDVVLLRLLEQIATRNGLVEFRLRIDALASRLEDDTFEVAFFGRVSSGKSSLLNALLGTDVLPVGVNPITAVPTKLRYGKSLKAAVARRRAREEFPRSILALSLVLVIRVLLLRRPQRGRSFLGWRCPSGAGRSCASWKCWSILMPTRIVCRSTGSMGLRTR